MLFKTKNNLTRYINIWTILFLLLISCRKHSEDININDSVDHWKITRTFKSFNNSTFQIDTIDNTYKVVDGHNQILIFSIEKNPVFKNGKELTDLSSTKSLLIELDPTDKVVTVQTPSKSKIFRKLIAFSPDHGIKPLHLNEKLSLTRIDSHTWTIDSRITEFVFAGEINFLSNQTLIENFDDY